MFTSKKVMQFLFGRTCKFNGGLNNRTQTISFPSSGEEGDVYRELTYRTDDGLIFYLLKRIENIEKQLKEQKQTAVMTFKKK